jgi:sialate O-acetylesterase
MAQVGIALSLLLGVSAVGDGIRPSRLFGDHMVLQRETRFPVWGWAEPGAAVRVAFAGDSVTCVADETGHWQARLGPYAASSVPRRLTVGDQVFRDVLVGDNWLLSGQSNMEMSMRPFPPWHEGIRNWEAEVRAADRPAIRLFRVVARPSHRVCRDVLGEWLPCTPRTVADFSAVAYTFGQRLQTETGVPQGLILSALGGTSIQHWRSPERLHEDPVMRRRMDTVAKALGTRPAEVARYENGTLEYAHRSMLASRENGPRVPFPDEPVAGYRTQPASCYRGMLAPLASFAVRGVGWYQGEADTSWAAGYAAAFSDFIAQLRSEWGMADLPVYFVQLANYRPPDAAAGVSAWAALRQAQLDVMRNVPHTGMAVAADLGESDQIHPRDKRAVGERLALWALRDVYGLEEVCSGPIAVAARNEGGEVEVRFQYVADGLEFRNSSGRTAFELAGTDGVFHAADVDIAGSGLRVHSEVVPVPCAVRYAWHDDPVLTLYNSGGLPASPFLLAVAP